MKHLIAFVFIIPMFVTAQPLVTNSDGRVEYSAIVEAQGLSAEQLYQSAKEWFIRSFDNANFVIQNDDKQGGSIIGKGSYNINRQFCIDDSKVTFVIKIDIKDGKYKYQINDFVHTSIRGNQDGGQLENDKPDCGTITLLPKCWVKIKSMAAANTEMLITSLKESMTNTVSKENW